MGIRGGSVNLGNASTSIGAATINTGGTLSLSGGSVGSVASNGTVNLAGGSIGPATIGGGVLSAIGGSITSLSASGGVVTISAPATLGSAIVNGPAFVALGNSNTMSSLTVSAGTAGTNGNTITTALVNGGTFQPQNTTISGFTHSSGVTTFGPSVTIGTANVAGAGTVNATNPVSIQSSLNLPAGVTASVAARHVPGQRGQRGQQHAVQHADAFRRRVDPYAQRPRGRRSRAAVNVFVPGNATGRTYVGTGPDTGDSGTVWNTPSYSGVTTSGLQNSAGVATAVSYAANNVNANWASGYASTTLLSTIANDNAPAVMTFTFSGLSTSPGQGYDLYAIMNSNANGRTTDFAVGGTSQAVVTANGGANTVTSPSTYAEFTNLIPSAGQIVITAQGPTATSGEFDVNGFQLVPVQVSRAVQPAQHQHRPHGQFLARFRQLCQCGYARRASLAGSVTLQDVASGGSVQFGGDVVASANAAVKLATGAGSAPTLTLAGNGGTQNIKAANSMTLTLPAMSISAATVNVGNATGYNGSVVLGGATSLSGASPTVNVNAGSLKVANTLSGGAVANVQVNAGGTLAGGPAGSIQVPVTVNTGGVLRLMPAWPRRP